MLQRRRQRRVALSPPLPNKVEQAHVVWGAAFMLLKRHENDAPTVVATRIGELAMAGDMEGMAIWKSIASCMDQLMRAPDSVAN